MKMTEKVYKRYPLESLSNFRDLGGYPTKNGGITKYGVFFRSASMSNVSGKDLKVLKEMGIKKIIDLRYHSESREAPDVSLNDPEIDTKNISLMEPISLDEIEVNSDEVNTATLVRMYIKIIERCGKQIAKVIDELAKEPAGGTLFHCVTGKDRTGIIAMLLLSIAGVDDSDIIADYEISHIYIKRFTFNITGSNYINMQELIRYINNKYSSAIEYLFKLGVKEDTIDILRRRFVE